MAGITQAQFEQAVSAILPAVRETIELAPAERRFTTRQFVEALRLNAESEAAYQRALAALSTDPAWLHAATQVLHGQVIPELVRASGSIRFAGFAHGEPDDGTAVPCYWLKER
jgi:hypothetical protein